VHGTIRQSGIHLYPTAAVIHGAKNPAVISPRKNKSTRINGKRQDGKVRQSDIDLRPTVPVICGAKDPAGKGSRQNLID